MFQRVHVKVPVSFVQLKRGQQNPKLRAEWCQHKTGARHTESKGRSHLLITSQDLLWQECKYVCSKVFSFKTANFMVRLNGTLKYTNLRKKSCGPRVHIKLAYTCCEAAVPWVRFIWANEIWLANYALIVSQNYMQFAFGKSLINSNDNANALSKHSFTELMILVNLIWFAT